MVCSRIDAIARAEKQFRLRPPWRRTCATPRSSLVLGVNNSNLDSRACRRLRQVVVSSPSGAIAPRAAARIIVRFARRRLGRRSAGGAVTLIGDIAPVAPQKIQKALVVAGRHVEQSG